MTTEVLQPPKLSTARLLLLGASSVVLCLSSLMAVFTPFPMAMAMVLYGRARGYAVAFLGLCVSLPLGYLMTGDFTVAMFYGALGLFAVVIAEALMRSWGPVKSIVVAGLTFMSCLGLVVGLAISQQNISPVDFFAQEITKVKEKLEVARSEGKFEQNLEDLGLARPSEEIAKEILILIPGYLFIGTFFVLWVNMFLALKGQRLLRTESAVKYDERALLGFKMPFFWAYFVAIGLALVVGADYLQLSWAEPVGMNLLRMLGVFYFFQGFGVLLDYLNHFGVLGLFRTLIVMAIVLVMPSLIAFLGLFDTWFDFTQKIRKKEKFKEKL